MGIYDEVIQQQVMNRPPFSIWHRSTKLYMADFLCFRESRNRGEFEGAR